jgi:ATP-dependent protease ClpP protease subunit
MDPSTDTNTDIKPNAGFTALSQLPDFTAKSFQELQDACSRKGIFFLGEVDDSLARVSTRIIAATMAGTAIPLYFLIDSTGGKSTPAWTLYHAIRNYPGPTIGIVVGGACSMAFLILQACSYRFAMPGTSGQIHSKNSRPLITAYNAEEVKFRQEQVMVGTRTMLEHLSVHGNMSLKDLEALAQLDEPFYFTEGGNWCDGIINLIPPLYPLPEPWGEMIKSGKLNPRNTALPPHSPRAQTSGES